MSHVLLITSSPRLESHSTKVARTLADRLTRSSNSTLTTRDLTRDSLPHIDDSFATARQLPPEQLTSSQKAALDRSDKLVKEFLAADQIIIAAGMINFGIPSTLKAYIDHIVRPGVTFGYSEKGPEGLVKGKKAYLVVARGGVYSEGPMQHLNFQDSYLRAILSFIGVSDIDLITIEGVAFGPEAADKAVTAALSTISTIEA